jgi:hypothetical protein
MNGTVGRCFCGQFFPLGYGRFVLSSGSEELRLLKNSTSILGHNNTSTSQARKTLTVSMVFV